MVQNSEVCSKCQGRGFYCPPGEEQSDASVWIRCNCREEAVLEKRFQQACIGGRYRQVCFDNFSLKYYTKGRSEAQRALAAAKDFCCAFQKNNYIDGLLFRGDPGTGKTTLAMSVGNQLIRQGVQVLAIEMPGFLSQLRMTFGDSEVQEAELLYSAQRVPVLILDDLGAEKSSEWSTDRLYQIISKRYDNRLPVIISTNLLTDQALIEHVGIRIFSRIMEMCHDFTLVADGDIRLLKKYCVGS